MKVLGTFGEVRMSAAGCALVPTMGYLHEGHLSLARLAASTGQRVVMSLFVNPLQFDEAEDLDRYPRNVERDAALATEAGVDILFVPEVAEVYPARPLTRVCVGEAAAEMEGARRPGHFEGVATVVAKLFAGLQPKLAFFGRKDAQQLVVVTRMAQDLSFPVEVVGGPTVREQDGLALSSRNVFLSVTERRAALALWRGLSAAADAVSAGERSGSALEGLVAAELHGADLVALEYAVLADATAAVRIPFLDRPAFLAVAARVGEIRLIDNVWLWPDGTGDLGVQLDRPSILYEVEAP